MPVINDGFLCEINFLQDIYLIVWSANWSVDDKQRRAKPLYCGVRKKYWDAWCMIRKLDNYKIKCSMPSSAWVKSIWLRKSLLFFVWHNHITWHWHIHHMQKDRRTIVMCWRGLFRKRGVSCDHALELVIGERLRCADLLNHPTTVRCHCMVLSGAVWWQECGELDSSHN